MSVSDPSATINYVRDNLGRATTIQNILGTLIGQQLTFHQSYANPLLQWESYDNRLSHRYLWSDSVDELLADEQFLAGMTAPNTKWALSDHQGTIKDIVDYNPATGVATVARHRKYDPFGDRRGTAAPTDIVFGYTGKYFDDVTGLQNNWNRWYDPKQGRFISQDPIGFAGGDENLYRYVGNSPTNATDPSGLEKELIGWVYEISTPNGTGWFVQYIGKADDLQQRFANKHHPAAHLLFDKANRIRVKPIFVDLDPHATSRGTMRAARDHAQKSIEQKTIGPTLPPLNQINAATETNRLKWEIEQKSLSRTISKV